MPDEKILPQVLLIETDIPTIELYERELAQNYKIIPCHDASSALNHLEGNDIDAIILEPAFLGVDEWKLLTTIKNKKSAISVPIVVCTTQDTYLQDKKTGVETCLVKPVLPNTLRQLIDNLIQNPSRNDM